MNSVSILLYGRNDDYIPGYLDRLKYCIQSFENNLSGLDYEIILVDTNQIKNKPLSDCFSSKKIVHKHINEEAYYSIFDTCFSSGVQLLKDEHNVNMEIDRSRFFCTTWATNAALSAATKDYIIMCSNDTLVFSGLKDLILRVKPNIIYKALSRNVMFNEHAESVQKSLSGNKKSRKFLSSIAATTVRVEQNLLIGNGLFYVIDTKSAREVGGYLPYTVHRGKGCDLFFSYMCDAFGKNTELTYCDILELNHEKTPQPHIWNKYKIIRNGIELWDFEKELNRLRGWISNNRVSKVDDSLFLKPISLGADRLVALEYKSVFDEIKIDYEGLMK